MSKFSHGSKSVWQSQLKSESNSDQHEDNDILTICDGSKGEEPGEMDTSVAICMYMTLYIVV